MQKGRRSVVAVAAVMALVAGGVLAAPAVARQVIHPRDPEEFQLYVTTYMDQWSRSDQVDASPQDLAWVSAHPQDALALGDDACTWLAGEDDAPDLDPSGATSWGARYEAALRETDVGTSTALSEEGKFVVIGGSWSYLCWWEREQKTAPASVSEYED